MNRSTYQQRELSPQGSVSASTRRNEATNGQRIAPSQWIGENLIVMRYQRTGVDPRDGVAHSHLLESNRNRGHSEVVRIGNNQGRSTTWNMFNKLSRGADIRETLNRRREQERSQNPLLRECE